MKMIKIQRRTMKTKQAPGYQYHLLKHDSVKWGVVHPTTTLLSKNKTCKENKNKGDHSKIVMEISIVYH